MWSEMTWAMATAHASELMLPRRAGSPIALADIERGLDIEHARVFFQQESEEAQFAAARARGQRGLLMATTNRTVLTNKAIEALARGERPRGRGRPYLAFLDEAIGRLRGAGRIEVRPVVEPGRLRAHASGQPAPEVECSQLEADLCTLLEAALIEFRAYVRVVFSDALVSQLKDRFLLPLGLHVEVFQSAGPWPEALARVTLRDVSGSSDCVTATVITGDRIRDAARAGIGPETRIAPEVFAEMTSSLRDWLDAPRGTAFGPRLEVPAAERLALTRAVVLRMLDVTLKRDARWKHAIRAAARGTSEAAPGSEEPAY